MTKAPLQRFALAAALFAVSSHSFAQFGGSGMGGGGRRGARPDASASPRTGDGLATPATAASQIRDKLYDMRLQLMITPEQSALWDRFSDAVWDLSTRGGLPGMPPPEGQTVAQLLQQRAAQAQDRARRMQTVSDALATLYEALSADQRNVADRNLAAVIP
ncbi:hypothetical protein NU688_04500 [Variovorax sp. ZS18.2.2]|uniref:hypothetical protein n=1 Tax=Variovorax sp. ZS18.2.2 TaxID=2971255 RepID=UPI002150A080|nr:hypothetical protein [Variovorax sp. ZS18.2.2]MCR6475409.1 hypothetical protein [Variovorax sp. ZS18.2.2]